MCLRFKGIGVQERPKSISWADNSENSIMLLNGCRETFILKSIATQLYGTVGFAYACVVVKASLGSTHACVHTALTQAQHRLSPPLRIGQI